jgi:hypothetical protein
MTVYTLDVAEYQPNPALLCSKLKAQGYAGLMARCVIGSYVDPLYAGYLAAAKANGLLFAAYWFPHTAVPLDASLDLLRAHIGDSSVPVGLLDWEADGSSVPSMSLMNAAQIGIAKRGLTSKSIYTYGGYWSGQGSPSLTSFRNLIGADYGGNPVGYGSAVYPGDGSTRWNGYGGFIRKTGLQFGSNVVIDGYSNRVDCNAWTLTRAQLVAAGLFKDFGAVTPPTPPVTPPNPAGLTAPAPKLIQTYVWNGVKHGVVEFPAVVKATYYLALGPAAPVWIPATTPKANISLPSGAYHFRAYAEGSTGPSSTQINF